MKINRFLANSLVIFSGLALLNPGSARAAIFIDDWTEVIGVEQGVVRGGMAPQIAISEQPDSPPTFSKAIGGYRDLWLQAVSGTDSTSTKTAAGSVANGILSFSNGPTVQSWLNVTWDGNDPGADTGNPVDLGTPAVPGNFADTATDLRKVIRNGLGSRDLTDGGTLNSIAIELLSVDLGIQLELTLYDSDTAGISRATYTFTQEVSEPTVVYFAFDPAALDVLALAPEPAFGALFTPVATAPDGARFTNIGAINLALKANRTDVDAQLTKLRATNTEEVLFPPEGPPATPEPSTSWLGLSAIGAAAFFCLKKRGKTNG